MWEPRYDCLRFKFSILSLLRRLGPALLCTTIKAYGGIVKRKFLFFSEKFRLVVVLLAFLLRLVLLPGDYVSHFRKRKLRAGLCSVDLLPCVAAIASVKRELGWKWGAGLVIWQCILAWIVSFIVRLILLLIGGL